MTTAEMEIEILRLRIKVLELEVEKLKLAPPARTNEWPWWLTIAAGLSERLEPPPARTNEWPWWMPSNPYRPMWETGGAPEKISYVINNDIPALALLHKAVQ